LSKKYGYALTILGIVLIAVGALNVAGYVNLQVVDTTPPKILYTYPANGMTYRVRDLCEIVIYAQDSSNISTVSYSDNKYRLLPLPIMPYTKLKHPLVTSGWKWPDVNFDGKVDTTDVYLIDSLANDPNGNSIGKPNYNEAYDLNSDGKINMNDITYALVYKGTVTFAFLIEVPPYKANETIYFKFLVTDQYGNTAQTSGKFYIASDISYETLSGIWKINDVEVVDNMLVEVPEKKATITFKCNDTTIPTTNIIATVKDTFKNVTYTLTFIGNYTWQTTIELSPGTNSLILEASASTLEGQKMSKISVQVVTPELPTFTIGHALIVVGIIFLIGGIIVKKKEEDIVYND
jgi:hypothetical protein